MPRGRRTNGKAARSSTRTWLRIAFAVALLGTVGAVQLTHAPAARADVQTGGQDLLRTDWDSAEPNLSASTVTSSNFGQLFATQLNGQIYAQPLVVGGTVLVSTENNWAYGLNAVTGAITWSRQLGPPWPASTISCGDLVPNLGSTSTGVLDPTTNTYYLTTKVNDGPDATRPDWYLHALDAATGNERAGWPTKIIGTPANDPSHPFLAETVNQRPALLLLDGSIYMAFGSQCDLGNYVGIVAGVNLTTQAISMWSDEVGPSSTQAGIWQSGGGIVSDGAGRMFVVTGNGVTAPDGPGNRPPQQLSESVVRLAVDGSGALFAQDFFAPYNAATLDLNDQDLASGAPVGLPSQYFGTTALPHLMVEIGKEGKLYLLNRDDLGGKAQGPNGTDAVIQELGPLHGVWGHPAVYGGEGGYLYITQNDSNLLAFKYGLDGQGNPSLTLAGNTTETFGFTSGSPIITSDGTTPGSAVLWVTNVDGAAGSNGRLCAYNAVPSNNHLTLLRCFPIGTGVKFPTAASANGRVYTGTRDGVLFGFGQPVTAALNLPQTEFGQVTVGQSGTATVTATAVRAVTITALGTTGPFTVTDPPPALPVSLAAGDKLDVPVTFSPTAPGSINGTLNITLTDAGQTDQLGATLHGTAIKPGFTATPPTLTFADVPVGDSVSLSASFTNTGGSDETVQSVGTPGSPFTVTGLPGVGTVIAPGQAVNVSVTYTPTSTGSVTSAVSVVGPDGTGTVSLVANAVTGVKQLSISPSSLTFGSIPVGLTSTQTITVTNSGNLNVTITKAAPPSLPYVVNTPLPEGLVMSPGDSVAVQVTFAPSAAGTFDNSYVISSDDGAGAHTISVSGTGVTPTGGRPLPSIVGGGGWVFNGSAAMSGSDLVLTPAVAATGGSAVYSTPVPGAGLRASFTAQIGGGNGADGMTFALLDAATNTPHSLGQFGGGLGFSGLTGIAVTLDTYQGGSDPSNNFIGLTKGTLDANGNLTYLATSTNIPNLRSGTHAIIVVTTTTNVTVSIDGVQVISTAVSLPGSVYPAFTGSTGGAYDQHV
ncbi:MAG: choice-of-anchor D domain-containing protein, partial [Betaproteobacteria bacterium]